VGGVRTEVNRMGSLCCQGFGSKEASGGYGLRHVTSDCLNRDGTLKLGSALRKPSLSKSHRQIWLDVGAHLGETTLEPARRDPKLMVYAFEPNLRLAAKMFDVLENYVVIPMAVAEFDGFAPFYLNRYDAASSLLPFNQEALRNWIGGNTLRIESEVLVPTIRLDTFLGQMEVERVDLLKIDTQGADFEVLKSAGHRLRDIQRIVLEVAITPAQLYAGAKEKSVIVDFLQRHEFVLIEARKQTHGQEENLTFVRKTESGRQYSA